MPLYAYKAIDEGAVMLILPRDWSQKNINQTQNSMNFLVKNNTLHAPDIEQINYSILRKENNDVEKKVNQLYATLNQQIKDCKVSNLQSITTNSIPFKEWIAHYRCPANNLIGIFIIVDADPVNMYLFSYQMSASQTNNTMLSKLVSMIQICYKKNPDPTCYFLLPGNA